MDRIELAERRFQQILPTTATRWLEARPRREVLVWLRDDVAPVLEEYVGRPAFRAYATWSLRSLTPGCGSPERRAVEAVDGDLVRAADALAGLADNDAVTRALVDLNPPRERPVVTAVVLEGDGPPRETREPRIVDSLELPWRQTRNIAARPWTDLVCPFDYFSPRGGMMLKVRHPEGVTEGEFVVSLNPELHPVGDFIMRCMFRRVDGWVQCLEDFRRLCYSAWDRAGRPDPALAEAEQLAWLGLRRRVSDLRVFCLTGGAATLRDSCVTLTQAYAAFHPAPDLSWLGLPGHILTHDPGALRHQITGSRSSESLERIATALGDLRRLPGGAAPPRSAVTEAVATGGLVLVDRPRAAYWAGERIDADWDRHPKPWEFLRELAAKALVSAAVGEKDLYADPTSLSTMANRLRRLKSLLPASLHAQVVPAGTRSYRLDLDVGRVHVLDAG